MAYPSPASSFPPNHSEIEIESESQTSPHYRDPAPSFANDASTFAPSTSTVAHRANENSSSSYPHDIFINHRGPDVKKTFASHLYHRLLPHGVRAFLDYQEMQQGEYITPQIKEAIATASVHVAIFSKGYADSHWCLDELLLMLNSGAPIIPVFYNVRPADLRWTEGNVGVYSQALHILQNKKTRDSETHEEKSRYDSNTIESWRKALASVSEINGFELDNYRHEGELLDKVVECLLKKVKTKCFNVAKCPTGLDKKMKHFENFLLQQPSGRPKVVGIVGLGGVGKTTLAKELFNRKRSYYLKCCFLSDVRENKGSLNELQRKLIQSLCGFDKQVNSTDEGISKLKNCISFFDKALLIVDDVDHVDQLDALLPWEVQDALPSNCLILITSRDKNVLLRSRVQDSSIYKLTGLNKQHSSELFCRHAFYQPHPQAGFEDLVDKIVGACDGLPLSLKVFGALLSGNDNKSYWQAQLNRLQNILPVDIQRKLRISYDSLDEEDQKIFLDVACFLGGEKRDTAIKIWDQSGRNAFLGFQNLQYKCLVEVDSESCIYMHDHLRQLGRNIAQHSGFRIPSLWDQTDNMNIARLLDMLKQSSEITQVRGIRMVPSARVVNDEFKYIASIHPDVTWFKRRTRELLGNCVIKHCNRQHNILTNLQLLITEDHLLERILRTARLPDLRWLSWYKCGHSSLPSWIPMENLRVLHVVGSALKKLWQGEAQAPLQLRELEIWAPLSKFPMSIGKLAHLERICIRLFDDNNVRSLPEKIGQLSSLKRFELINARKMKSLPDSFGNLTNLEHLNLSFSRSLERLPDSFENLNRLKYLDLKGCDNLDLYLSREMRRTKEGLADIMTWKSIPRAVRETGRAAREVLKYHGAETQAMKAWQIGWDVGRKACRMGMDMGREAWQIRMDMARDEWLKAERKELEKAKMEGRWKAELEDWWNAWWGKAESEDCWSAWWEEAELEDWWNAGWNAVREALWAAERKVAEQNAALELWAERQAPVERELRAESQALEASRVERELRASRVERELLTENQAREAAAREAARVALAERERWAERERRAEREEIMKNGQSSVNVQLLPLQLPQSLQELHTRELPRTVENLYNLEVLELESSLLKILPSSLSDLRSLKELRLVNCHRLKCLPDSLGPLTELEVKSCHGLLHVGTLPNTLIQLNLISCPYFKKKDGFSGLAKLQMLNISGWRKVEELTGIETLVSLEELRASRCEKLKRIRGLAQLTDLRLLDVRGCSMIEELEGVEHLRSLEKLDATGCSNLLWDSRLLEQLPQRLKEENTFIHRASTFTTSWIHWLPSKKELRTWAKWI